jgi:hypothetical protein
LDCNAIAECVNGKESAPTTLIVGGLSNASQMVCVIRQNVLKISSVRLQSHTVYLVHVQLYLKYAHQKTMNVSPWAQVSNVLKVNVLVLHSAMTAMHARKTSFVIL